MIDNMPNVESECWTHISALGMGAKRLVKDTDGAWWVGEYDGPNVKLTEAEASDLCGALCESLGLAVLNEPARWGNGDTRCECDEAPDKVLCYYCDECIELSGERLEWNPGGLRFWDA